MRALKLEPAHRAREGGESRLLSLRDGEWKVGAIGELPSQFRRGDVAVVNDSATLPASLRTEEGLEIRLMGRVRGEPGTWHAVALGAGDWRTPTERRPFPRAFRQGEILRFGGGQLSARVEQISDVSEAWLRLHFEGARTDFLLALFALGTPIQYSYLESATPLYQTQTTVSARPWSVEMPSAVWPLNWTIFDAIRARGAVVVPITHGCGISSTGDPRIDRMLPLEEEYEIPTATAQAIRRSRIQGGRVIAIGTSVVRALESAEGRAGCAWTDLRLGPDSSLKVADGLLTGLHEPGGSHFELLGAFIQARRLQEALVVARDHALQTHEYGDSLFILREAQK